MADMIEPRRLVMPPVYYGFTKPKVIQIPPFPARRTSRARLPPARSATFGSRRPPGSADTDRYQRADATPGCVAAFLSTLSEARDPVRFAAPALHSRRDW